MVIETLELSNFRNYDTLFIELDSGINIFYGDNAQGKTNILESIYLCGTTKSHRGSKDKEMIQFQKEESHIRMSVVKKEIPCRIDMHLKRNKAKVLQLTEFHKKASELFGMVNMVFFSPEDLNIIKDGPSERRKFIDIELCQLNKVYLSELSSYQHVLNQRNKLLKDISFSPDLRSTLDVWDEQLIHYGERIIFEREQFIEELNHIILDIHKNLTGEKEILNISYEPNVSSENFAALLKENRERT